MLKKLFWLEYSEMTFYFKEPFESVGFQVKYSGWMPRNPPGTGITCLPEIQNWKPDVLLFSVLLRQEHFVSGLREWLEIHQAIKQDQELSQMKVVVLTNAHKSFQPEQVATWEKACDRLFHMPFQCITYPKIVAQLLGEEVGLAGVNNYLMHNGQWVTHDSTSLNANQMLPDAEGNFARPPLTRVLVAQSPSELSWLPSVIQVERPTNIVYLLKSQEEWRNGLHESEVSRLSTLARSVTSQHQLLVGVNDSLLQLEREQATRVIKQIQQTGKWKVFVTEHLWVEWMLPHHFFEDVAYNREHSKVKDTFVI